MKFGQKLKFWWLFIDFNFFSSFFWHSFSHLRRNSKNLKSLKSHQNFSFWPIFKNSGPKCAEDHGLSKKNLKKILRGSKGVKKIKKSKKLWNLTTNFEYWAYFAYFGSPKNFCFFLFWMPLVFRTFLLRVFENRAKTEILVTFYRF